MTTASTDTCRVLIVEDEAVVQLHLRRLLTSLGYEVVGAAASATDAITLARETRPDLVLMDIRLRGEPDGISAATEIRAKVDPAIIFLTAYADEQTVRRTEAVGAVGYIVKPYSRNEVRAVLTTALGVQRRIREAAGTAAAAPRPPLGDCGQAAFHGMTGNCGPMREVFERIRDVAGLNWAVLIEGQTGTGKELTARALHAESSRRGGPFIAVNCAGLTDTLLTSQLFGHKRGAFTGAVNDQPGFFEQAHGGTLFLDEIADISAAAQQALLRVLEERVVQRVGETRERPVDVRVISATQRDLAAEVTAGRFRSDLLYRLRAIRITLPALHERGDDVLLLARHFLAQAAAQAKLEVHDLDAAACRALQQYRWPGNVRELRHAIEHAVLSCRQGIIRPEHLPPEILTIPADGPEILDSPADERERILRALQRSRGNRMEAARLLGISRATLYRRFTELEIDPDLEDLSAGS